LCAVNNKKVDNTNWSKCENFNIGAALPSTFNKLVKKF